MPEQTMIEMVARTAFEKRQEILGRFAGARVIDWSELGGREIEIEFEVARAAIDAMRSPTEEMWQAWRSVNCKIGTDGMEEFTYFSGDYGNWLACHMQMIDSALSQSTTHTG